MNYRGKIVTLSRPGRCREEDVICTAHYAGHIDIVPIKCDSEHVVYPTIVLEGPNYTGTVTAVSENAALIENVKKRCRSRIKDMLAKRVDESELETYKGLHKNLDQLQSLDGDQPVKREEPTPYDQAMNRVFAEVYGKPDYTGKLVFLETPLNRDIARGNGTTESGEYIVIRQTNDSLYCYKTTSCLAGCRLHRLPFSLGDDSIAILDSYEDDSFVREFIDRLDDMDTETYDTLECDYAETASRQLSRMLEQKASRVNRVGAFFGPIGTTKSNNFAAQCESVSRTQTEDRCHRACCGAK